MPNHTRVHRLLRVLTLIQGGDGWTPARLAAECGVAERTIFRDLNELEGAGLGVEFDHAAQGYRVGRDVFLPPVQLTAREALALTVLCGDVAEREQIPFTAPAWRALTKVLASLPAGVREEVAAVSDAVVVQTAAATPPDGHVDVYERVQHAIATGTALSCRYEAAGRDGDDDAFEFEPYALYFAVRAWYTVGLHHGRDALRTLKLNRFSMAAPTDRPYTIPDGFSVGSQLGNAWRMIRGDTTHEVELLFDREFAETIADTLWHRTQRVEFGADGGATFRCTVDGLDEIVWWVLSMGEHCRVVAPDELRERVRLAAEATAALYQ